MGCISNLYFSQDKHSYRLLINDAEKSSADSKIFLAKVNADYQKTKKPIFLALSGVGNFFLAKNSYNPFNKISFLNKGKKMLDKAVELENNNLEIRFLRYISQKKIPKILGYNQNLKEDEIFLRKNYSKSKDAALVKEIKKYLNLK